VYSFTKFQPCRLIIDINHLAHRCWATNGTLTNSKGQPTGVIYGTIKSIQTLSAKFKPDQIIGVEDSGRPFRIALYENYKAHRTDEFRTPAEIESNKAFNTQLKDLKIILEAAGIPVLKIYELEADDLAAVVSTGIPFKGTTILVSGDRDFIQLVKPNVALYSPMINKLLTYEGPELSYNGSTFNENYETTGTEDQKKLWDKMVETGPLTFTRFQEKLPRGIPLDRWLLYRALVGDSSDNLPGVTGIGPVAALKLVEQFCSFNVLRDAGEEYWKQYLNKKQVIALSEAFRSGDLTTQHMIMDLSIILRTEGCKDLIDLLNEQIQNVKPDEMLIKKHLIKWEMSSLLVGWKQFLNSFPAFRTL
jgi:5'-3' exonuclease